MSGGKPRASDYEEVVKRRLLKAMSIYETYIYVTYGYPRQEHQIQWVHKAWGLADEGAVEKYEMTHHMERLVCDSFLIYITVYHNYAPRSKTVVHAHEDISKM
jgi:hypothetical protein